ncbi:hypothetical protein L3X38_022939 [Prunus dulcis]|uniref:Disease resistance N-terminal domain-containing protein n=1 Tax=Prunus dulcis TaxID=3755 RepID=A0AAD4VWX4_PRUDU|nr:hypothetical protein L3X38_022939 [Prunus dulcis]
MADIAVQVALVVAEKAIIFLYHKLKPSRTHNVHDDFQNAKKCLERMRAYLRDYSASSSSSSDLEVLQTRVKEIQNIAYEIEDVLDTFMLKVPHQFHSNRLSEKFHDFVHDHDPSVQKAGREFSSAIKNIIDNKLNFLSALDKIHQVLRRDQEGQPSSSTARRGDNTVYLLNIWIAKGAKNVLSERESRETEIVLTNYLLCMNIAAELIFPHDNSMFSYIS